MRTETVNFYSRGVRLEGLWRCPESDGASGPLPVVVQGPGWLGLKESKLYIRYHQALVEAGFAVLVFDYRGSGASEGERTKLSPAAQLEDLVAAVSYVSGREDADPERIGVFGSGGTGGGNAVMLARRDRRIRAAVSQLPVADGADWLHRMRSEEDWLRFLHELEDDPRKEIMVATAERASSGAKSDVDGKAPDRVSLETADEILEYRPLEAARGLTTPLLVIGVEDDAVTPTDHALRLYEVAAGPRELIIQRKTSHYAAYDRYWSQVTPEIVGWFERHLVSPDLTVRSA